MGVGPVSRFPMLTDSGTPVADCCLMSDGGRVMDAEWAAALAGAGGAALVGAAATDAWQFARAGFARLLGRGDARRRELAETRLDATAADLERAGDAGRDEMRQVLLSAWQTRLADLLSENPDAADALRALTEQITAALPAERQTRVQAVRTGAIIQTGGGIANTGVVMGNVNTGGAGQ